MVIVLGFLTLPLVGAPLWTEGLFHQALEWQRHQIAVDNAAIRLGREEREWRDEIEQLRRRLDRWEKWHHVWHACARVPATAKACLPTDRLIERLLRRYLAWRRWRWEVGWQSAGVRARREAAGLGVPVALRGRPLRAPVRLKRCPHCGLRTRIVWEPRPWRVRVFVSRPRRLGTTLVSGLTHPQGYRLAPLPGWRGVR